MVAGWSPLIRPGSIGRVWTCLLLLTLAAAFPLRTRAADTVLHTFNGYDDGATPVSVLIQGKDGAYYGTTSAGGTDRDGTVFRIDSSGTLTTLHSFTGADGQSPYAGLLQTSDGTLYGVTDHGGAHGDGAVFKLNP